MGFHYTKWCLENCGAYRLYKIRVLVYCAVLCVLAGTVGAQTPTPTPSDSDQLQVVVNQLSSTNEFIVFAIGLFIAFIATDKVRP